MNWYKPWRTVGVALTLTLTTTVGIVAMSAIAPAQQPPADQQAATPRSGEGTESRHRANFRPGS